MGFKQHFRTGTVKVGEGEEVRSFEVSPWLPAGTLLASLKTDSSAPDDKEAQETVLAPGPHVEHSADKRGLLAAVSGYPRLSTKKEGSTRVVIVEIEPLLVISEDGWSVKLNLYPPIDGYPAPDQQQILEQLEQAGVRWGVREKAIAGALDKVHGERTPVPGLVIARGRMPVNGQNGKLRIEVQVGEQPGREQSDGSIDFKERNVFIGVDADQLLATRIAATAGLPGINVYGHEVPQLPGKELSVKSGADIVYDEQTGQIRAACGGVVSVINDTTVKVTSKQVISEDIDFTTGNVRSKGGVEVGGSVKPGFILKAGGDVLVNGIIESGQVAGANVIARGGVTGKQSIIEAGGDVFLYYLEEGRVVCHGAVHIAKEAYFADVRCHGSVTSGAESRIIGSKLFAGGSLSLVQVDTDSSPHSSLAVAVDFERFERLGQLIERQKACEEVVFRLRHRLGPGGTSPDLEEHEEELADCRRALQDFNLIPVSADDDTAGGLRFACGQKIEIAGIIQAGATIRIGNSEAILKHTCREGFFALNSETQKITFYSSRNPLQNIVL
ncbi:DUF342 domain-containing protein [Desulfofustis glycolicus]|uniref:Flagellar Assembly Protein A N-terminal region domain-containing protein n=1 Tax=Desulfofustis glycolicus DSM 9705 TaxID=1121409 RepID=A0A1M5SHK2_9BACT|nr:FapA family protein [Desulfofustis glycolicus]MCB2215808.1 FapA family protein [Desulfobulbaceae bacterium]SHH37880.1 hypothetical protein SAMN02745124_00352 [Desulfofustis glycolicus DSM 9705]